MYKDWTVADIEKLAENIPNLKEAFPDIDTKTIPWSVLMIHFKLTEEEKEREQRVFENLYAQGAFSDSEFMETIARG